MQRSEQKRGQIGLRDAAAQYPLRCAGFSQAREQRAAELRDVVWPAVGQRMLCGMPRGFDGIEFRGISRQLLQMQPGILIAEIIQPFGMMDRRTIPDYNDVPAQMPEQVPEKVVHLIVRDVLGVEPEVEPQPTALGADRQAADHRDSGMVVVVANHRSLAHRRPGASDGRDQHEAGFVGEDDVGTQPRSVFFTRGQSLRFHCSMRASSRSSARRSGFWQLKPKSCSRRAT